MVAQYSKEEKEKMQTPQMEVAQTPVEEIQTPTEEPQQALATPQPTTWTEAMSQAYDGLTAEYGLWLQSQGDAYEQKAAESRAYQKKLDDAQQLYMDALNNKRSVMGALLQKQKPVYDAEKEKRLRNNAIIQSFGDLMTEAAKGAFAFNNNPKSGAGVYIPRDKDYALNDINEINRMRAEYLKRNEAWEDLGIKYEAENAASKVAAADALRTKTENEYKEARKAEDVARGEFLKGADTYLKREQERIKDLIATGQKEEAAKAQQEYNNKRLYVMGQQTRNNYKGKSAEEKLLEDCAVYYAGMKYHHDKDYNYMSGSVWKKASGEDSEYAGEYSIYDLPDQQRKMLAARNQNNPEIKLMQAAVTDGETMYDAYMMISPLSKKEQKDIAALVAGNPTVTVQAIIEQYKKANVK